MNEITFYGKDFTRVSEATVKGPEGLEDPIAIDGCGNLTYIELLEQFLKKKRRIPKDDLDDEPEGKFLHSYFNNEMWFGRWVGVFRDKNFLEEKTQKAFDITLEISCRFDTDKNAFFLMAMLLCLEGKDLRGHFIKPEVNISFPQVMDIFLLFMFRNQLIEAANKGIFRKYQRFENNDSRPHGTIDIARHIRENMGLERGSIAYHYRELTAGNPVNRLILAAYKRLREKHPELCETFIDRDEIVSSTLNMLKTELGWSKTNLRNMVKDNLRPVTHPYFSEYEALRRTCLKILRDEGVSIFDAEGSEETDAIYFNITRLWERYIEYQFRKLEPSHRFKLSPQVSKNFLTGLFENKSARPDFLIQKDGENFAILDAKFKESWEDYRTNYKLLTKDIYKCIRDMHLFKTQRTGVIFPTGNGAVLESGENPVFDLVGVHVPKMEKGQPFEKWSKELDESVSGIFKKYLTQISMDASATSQQ